MGKKEIGSIIKKFREQKAMSQADLAKLMNTTRQCISSWEKDRTEPDIDAITALAKIFNVTIAEMFGAERQSPLNMAEQMRLSRETGIPLHKLGVNPNDYNNLMRHNIIRNKVSEEIADDFMNYIIGAAEDNQLSPSEISSLMDTHEKMVDAIEKENDKYIKYYASAGESKIHDIKSISTKIPIWDEAAPTNALDTDKLLELGNIIKKMDNDQLAKLIKHANLIEKGEL